MNSWGNVPLNSVIPFFFDAFDGGTGASITLTGIAVTDVEIYKGTSMTQRSSDAGVVLLDTDGIDVDAITGIHGFSIDTSDNTDAGFYAAGSFYTVVVASVTIDAQTVNFVAGTFRLTAAEGVAGVADVNVTHVGDTAQTAGDIMADTNDIQTRLPAALVSGRMDSSVGAIAAGVDLSATMKASVNTEVDSALDTAIPGVPTADSVNQRIRSMDLLTEAAGAGDLAAILVDTAVIGAAGAGLTAVPWNAAWDAEVESEVDDALGAGTGTALTAIPWNAAWDAEVQSEVEDALDVTIADSVPADGTRPSVRSGILQISRILMEMGIVGTTMTVYKEDGTTAAMTFTLNSATDPSAVTRAT